MLQRLLSHKCFYFFFSHFLLQLHQTPTFIDLAPNSKVSFRLPCRQRCCRVESLGPPGIPPAKRLSADVLCRGVLATWAADSAPSCDKAPPSWRVACMFDAHTCVCVMVGVCRATLPECWCVTLQHCLAYPVNLLHSSPLLLPSSHVFLFLSRPCHLICWSLLFILLPFVFVFRPSVQSH